MSIKRHLIWSSFLSFGLLACQTNTTKNTTNTSTQAPTTVEQSENNTTSLPEKTNENWTMSIEDFVQKGQTLLIDADGDLNNDAIPDKVLVYNNPTSQAKTDDFSPPRTLVILQSNPQGQYRLWASSDQVILCEECGGLTGDPLRELKIEQGAIVIKQDGGSRERWERNSHIVLDMSSKKWMVVYDQMKVVDMYDASNNHTRNIIEGTQLPLKQYDVYNGQ